MTIPASLVGIAVPTMVHAVDERYSSSEIPPTTDDDPGLSVRQVTLG